MLTQVEAPPIWESTPLQRCVLIAASPQGFHTNIVHLSESRTAKLEVNVSASLVAKIPLLTSALLPLHRPQRT